MEEQGRLAQSLAYEPQVTVSGPTPFTVTADTIEELEVRTVDVEIICATGSSYTAAWTGPTVGSLLDTASVSPETTHVVVESADAYRVVIPIREALGGVVSYLKDREPIGAHQDYMNRMVSPGTEGARDIKGVSRIEPKIFEPDEEPESAENLFPDGKRFTANRIEKDDLEQAEWQSKSDSTGMPTGVLEDVRELIADGPDPFDIRFHGLEITR
ncbi:MAG: molybdopterin-dependent oxidoreductase [Halodesulfurarchaeum sp.]|nr:molybdopterin-dependent oxidoreductase [Halodesulfurarchaeum sp.]